MLVQAFETRTLCEACTALDMLYVLKSNVIMKHSGQVDHLMFKLDKAQSDRTNLESWFIGS